MPSNLIIHSVLRHRDAQAGVERELYRVTEHVYDEGKSTTDKSVVGRGEKRKSIENEPEADGGVTMQKYALRARSKGLWSDKKG